MLLPTSYVVRGQMFSEACGIQMVGVLPRLIYLLQTRATHTNCMLVRCKKKNPHAVCHQMCHAPNCTVANSHLPKDGSCGKLIQHVQSCMLLQIKNQAPCVNKCVTHQIAISRIYCIVTRRKSAVVGRNEIITTQETK